MTARAVTARAVIAIDPGYAKRDHGCACAYGTESLGLCDVWFERRTDRPRDIPILTDVAVEMPQQDERSRAIPPAVLMALSWEGAALAYRYAAKPNARIHELTPSEWKGSEPKPAQHARLLKVLGEEELDAIAVSRGAFARAADVRAYVLAALDKGARDRWRKRGVEYYPARSITHNLLDAVAIWATIMGRFRKL